MNQPPLRLGVVTDIHGNLPALRAVVADAGVVDVWLNLGDIVSGPLWPAETLDFLMAQAWPTIAGNHERQVLTLPPEQQGASDRFAAERLSAAHRAWLAALPPTLRPLPQQPDLLCVHGTPSTDLVYLLETVTPDGLRQATDAEVAGRLGGGATTGVSLLLCGHSHVPRDVTLNGLRIVNPGSVGLQAYDDDHPYEHVVEIGSPHARYAIVEHDAASGWQVTLRAVVYDWEAAARRAEESGRLSWADALRTGRMGRKDAALRPAG